MIGIVIPALVGYQWKGVLELLIFCSLDVVLPYSVIILCLIPMDHNDSEERRDRRVGHNARGTRESPTTTTTLESLLIVKKVLPAGKDRAQRKSFGKRSIDLSLKKSSYRSNHPKSDIYARETNHRKDDGGGMHTTGNSSLSSMQLCAICLEDYQVCDCVAWSRNDACHHVFHKHCVLQHLKSGHQDCPICRNSYHVVVDVENG
jgi:hypothetical protein